MKKNRREEEKKGGKEKRARKRERRRGRDGEVGSWSVGLATLRAGGGSTQPRGTTLTSLPGGPSAPMTGGGGGGGRGGGLGKVRY